MRVDKVGYFARAGRKRKPAGPASSALSVVVPLCICLHGQKREKTLVGSYSLLVELQGIVRKCINTRGLFVVGIGCLIKET